MLNRHAQILGKIGGSRKSERKRIACIENGKKGVAARKLKIQKEKEK